MMMSAPRPPNADGIDRGSAGTGPPARPNRGPRYRESDSRRRSRKRDARSGLEVARLVEDVIGGSSVLLAKRRVFPYDADRVDEAFAPTVMLRSTYPDATASSWVARAEGGAPTDSPRRRIPDRADPGRSRRASSGKMERGAPAGPTRDAAPDLCRAASAKASILSLLRANPPDE